MIILIILGFIFVIVGIVGCFLPVLPGPPISYIGLLLGYFTISPRPFTPTFLIVMGVIMIFVTLIDYVFPPVMAKRYGASRYATWGAALGMLVGLIFFPPFGIFVGALLGAIFAEIIFNKKIKPSLRAGMGVFIGFIMGIFLKLSASLLFGYYLVKAVIQS